MTINPMVLDVSHHNAIARGGFERMRDFGIRGIIHKASQGLSYADPTYAQRRHDATAAGLLWGAYHFADSSDPKTQALRFLSAANPDGETLLALDYEPCGDKTMTLEGARAFLQAIEAATGRKAVLYSGNLIKETLRGADPYFGSHRLWLAQYSDHPVTPPSWASPWLWQFSGDGVNAHGISIPGIAGQVDINSFAGSADLLTTQWAGGAATRAQVQATISEQDRVRALQEKLMGEGFDVGRVDGLLGPNTIRAFQQANGLKPDGIVGPMTRPKLTAALAWAVTKTN